MNITLYYSSWIFYNFWFLAVLNKSAMKILVQDFHEDMFHFSGINTQGIAFALSHSTYVFVLSCVRLFVTPWTVVRKVPLSMEFSRQEYRSGQPFHSPGDFPDPGVKPRSPALQADYLLSEPDYLLSNQGIQSCTKIPTIFQFLHLVNIQYSYFFILVILSGI